MLAASVKEDIATPDGLDRASGIADTGEGGEDVTRRDRQPQSRRHSGLSALIQAATAQLGQLAEVASGQIQRVRSETDEEGVENTADSSQSMRDHPKPDPNRQTFPELLMTLAVDPSNVDVITFLPDGKFFAIRAKEFAEEVMIHYFAVTTFEEFLELSNDWGFNRILQDSSLGIEVFRHPLFLKGDWEKSSRIKFGESPTDARVSALPERAKMEYSISDVDASNRATETSATPLASPAATKRRLSPGFLSRRASETSVSSKHRVVSKDSELPTMTSVANTDRSRSDSDCNESLPAFPCSHNSQSGDVRSIALAITTEQIKFRSDDAESNRCNSSIPLVEEAVESCTQTIVTDAIESLLRDESHTKETYLKHESELGKSTLPGVVPISKQLFSPKNSSDAIVNGTPPSEVSAKRPSVSPPTADEGKNADCDTSSLEPSPEPSPTLQPANSMPDKKVRTLSAESSRSEAPQAKQTP